MNNTTPASGAPTTLRAVVYFDGFNFYHGCFKGSRGADWKACKWLNLSTYCSALLPSYSVEFIRYFTARVQSLPPDPGVDVRQDAYLRALGSLSNVVVHVSTFQVMEKWRYIADHQAIQEAALQGVRLSPSAKFQMPLRTECIVNIEEKGSDVNLASYLLLDGFEDHYDVAVVFSNDSDLATPIALTLSKLKKKVILLNPHGGPPTHELNSISGVEIRRIRLGPLQANQFPPVINAGSSTITKPANW